MPRYGKDTKIFPLSVWVTRGHHLTTVPKILADAAKAGDEVEGVFKLKAVGGKLTLVLERKSG